MNLISLYSSILVNLLLVISHANCDDDMDLYGILEVSPNASTNDIKKAYRKLAAIKHPDKNKDDPDATSTFQNINVAYGILSDEEKRKLYDRCGMKCVEREGSMEHSDPFASFFGDFGFGFGGDERGPRDTPKGGTITMDLFVSLEELYSGNFVEV